MKPFKNAIGNVYLYTITINIYRGAYDMTVFGICQSFGWWYGDLNKKWMVFGISVNQRWRKNTISDRKYNGDGIWLQYYGNFWKNQGWYGNLKPCTPPLYHVFKFTLTISFDNYGSLNYQYILTTSWTNFCHSVANLRLSWWLKSMYCEYHGLHNFSLYWCIDVE